MREILTTIKRIVHEVAGDLVSCKNRFLMLEGYTTNRHLLVFVFVTLIILGIVIFSSGSQPEFYLNLLKLLIVLLMSFFVYCQSDCFWFLIAKAYLYDYNIKHRRHMKIFMDRANEASFNETGNIQGYILLTAFSNSHGYKRHATRYLIEICLMLFAFLYIMPDFFLYNLGIFVAMFFYVFLYEREASAQVFGDIILLINCIRELIKDDPKKCREFILDSKYQEIRDLKKLYKFVLEATKI